MNDASTVIAANLIVLSKAFSPMKLHEADDQLEVWVQALEDLPPDHVGLACDVLIRTHQDPFGVTIAHLRTTAIELGTASVPWTAEEAWNYVLAALKAGGGGLEALDELTRTAVESTAKWRELEDASPDRLVQHRNWFRRAYDNVVSRHRRMASVGQSLASRIESIDSRERLGA